MEEKLKSIVSKVFGIPPEEVNDTLRKGDGEWDSFNHLLLISEIEKKFVVKFSISQIENINKLEDLRHIIIDK
jgi:acyl carrier protein